MVWGGRLVADWMECWGFNLLGLTMKIGLTVCWVERLKCLPIWFYKIMKDCFFSSWANFAVPVEETQQWVEKTQQWACAKQPKDRWKPSQVCAQGFDSSIAEHNDSRGQLVHNIHIAQWNDRCAAHQLIGAHHHNSVRTNKQQSSNFSCSTTCNVIPSLFSALFLTKCPVIWFAAWCACDAIALLNWTPVLCTCVLPFLDVSTFNSHQHSFLFCPSLKLSWNNMICTFVTPV